MHTLTPFATITNSGLNITSARNVGRTDADGANVALNGVMIFVHVRLTNLAGSAANFTILAHGLSGNMYVPIYIAAKPKDNQTEFEFTSSPFSSSGSGGFELNILSSNGGDNSVGYEIRWYYANKVDIERVNDVQVSTTGSGNVQFPRGFTIATGNDVNNARDEVLNRLRGLIMANGTVGSTGNDPTHVHMMGNSYGSNEIVNRRVTIRHESENEYHDRWITAWNDADQLATLDEALPFTPSGSGDTWFLLAVSRRGYRLGSDGLTDITAWTVNIDGSLSGSVGSINGITFPAGFNNLTVGNIQSGLSTLTEAQVNAQADTALSDIGATGTRMGYLDKLNISGNVAGSSEVTSIQNNTRVVRVVPATIALPSSGTQAYRIELFLYDDAGNMEAPDSAPTIALVNQTGTDRSSRLDSTTMALVETGRYRAIYTSTAGDTKEQLVWAFTVVEGGATRKYGNDSRIDDVTATDFTSADRAKLDALHDDRLTVQRATNLDNLDASISSRASATALQAVDDNVDAIKVVVVDKLDTMLVAGPGTYQFTQSSGELFIEPVKAKTDNLPSIPIAHSEASGEARLWVLDASGNAIAPASATTSIQEVINLFHFSGDPGEERVLADAEIDLSGVGTATIENQEKILKRLGEG